MLSSLLTTRGLGASVAVTYSPFLSCLIQRWLAALVATISTWFAEHKNEIRAFFASIGAWVSQTFTNFKTFVANHPEEFKIVGIVIVVIILLAVVIPQALMYFLQAIGFAAHGVVEGSPVMRQLEIFI